MGKFYLLVWELSGVFLYVPLVQVSGHVHQPDFGQPKVCELDVSHWCDQQTVGGGGGGRRKDIKGCKICLFGRDSFGLSVINKTENSVMQVNANINNSMLPCLQNEWIDLCYCVMDTIAHMGLQYKTPLKLTRTK